MFTYTAKYKEKNQHFYPKIFDHKSQIFHINYDSIQKYIVYIHSFSRSHIISSLANVFYPKVSLVWILYSLEDIQKLSMFLLLFPKIIKSDRIINNTGDMRKSEHK